MSSTSVNAGADRGPRLAKRRSRVARPSRSHVDERLLVGTALAGIGILAASGLARSRGPMIAPFDRKVRRLVRASWWHRVPQSAWWSLGRHTRRHALAEAVAGLTGEAPTLAAGALAAAAVARRHGPFPALPVLVAVPLGLAAHAAVKYSVRRPRPLWARVTGKHTPSFPSGHAARGAAAAGIVGYVAARERLAPAGVVFPLGAAVAMAGGGGRVYVDRHWATDVIGGWALGAAAAAVCALWYERLRPED